MVFNTLTLQVRHQRFFLLLLIYSCSVFFRWNNVFKSRVVQAIALYGNTTFMVAIAILVFLLIGTSAELHTAFSQSVAALWPSLFI